jgi:hypothetical protein
MPNADDAKLRRIESTPMLDFMSRLREWWSRRDELATIDRCELQRIAGDLGMSADELKELAARGPHAADELRERVHLLGITTTDVERVAHGLTWDLQRVCAHCNQKEKCRTDLARGPNVTSWAGYCPNASALTAIKCMLQNFSKP